MVAPVVYAAIAAYQIYGSNKAAQEVEETARENRRIAEINAQYAELDAYDSEIDGFSEVAKYQSIIDGTLAEQQLRLTAADVDVTYGSAGTIRAESEVIGELNKLEIEKRYQDKAAGYREEAKQYRLRGEAGLETGARESSRIKEQGLFNAANTGISGYNRSVS